MYSRARYQLLLVRPADYLAQGLTLVSTRIHSLRDASAAIRYGRNCTVRLDLEDLVDTHMKATPCAAAVWRPKPVYNIYETKLTWNRSRRADPNCRLLNIYCGREPDLRCLFFLGGGGINTWG